MRKTCLPGQGTVDRSVRVLAAGNVVIVREARHLIGCYSLVGQGVHPRDKEKHMAARTVRRRRSVLIAAAVLALPIAGITPATAADQIAPVSGTLAQLLSAVAGGTQLTALVHATDASHSHGSDFL